VNRAGTINGCAVSLQRSPDKDGNWLTTSCELRADSAWKCRFAMSYRDPMEPGMDCELRECGECLCLAAKLDALHMALAMINDETSRINREIENA